LLSSEPGRDASQIVHAIATHPAGIADKHTELRRLDHRGKESSRKRSDRLDQAVSLRTAAVGCNDKNDLAKAPI